MNIGFHIVQQEVAERAVVRERRRVAAPERRSGLRHGGAPSAFAGKAVERISKKNPRAAWRLLQGYLARTPERRSGHR